MILILSVAGLLASIYFLLLRSQKKRKREHQQMLAVLAPDYEITTIGGLHGTQTHGQNLDRSMLCRRITQA